MPIRAVACAAAAAACLDAAAAFAPTPVLPATSRVQRCATPLALRASVDDESSALFGRRSALQLAVLASPMLVSHQAVYAEGTEIKKSKKQLDAEYEEDLADMKQARYGRQPTRLDVERCVPKIVSIKGVMDATRDALEQGDLAAVAKAVGDQSIEATKSNINLGKEISQLQVSRYVLLKNPPSFLSCLHSAACAKWSYDACDLADFKVILLHVRDQVLEKP